jgi:hypothetical protein
LIVAVAGCNGPPSAVQPTLVAVHDIGLTCGDGVRDNVPSGLYQWRCEGLIDGMNAVILVEGNDQGVAGITLVTKDPVDADATRVRLGRLLQTVPPLDREPGLAETLVGWSGAQQRTVVSGVAIFALCDATQCIIAIMSAGDALKPMP